MSGTGSLSKEHGGRSSSSTGSATRWAGIWVLVAVLMVMNIVRRFCQCKYQHDWTTIFIAGRLGVMPTASTVTVEVLNLATLEWLPYPFAGSRPGFTLIEGPIGGVWIANNLVRFPR